MFSFACGSIHQGLDPGRFSDESRGRREIYRCLQLGALFVDSRINGGAKISIKYSFMEDYSFFSVHSAEVMCPGKHSSVRSKLPTLVWWSRRKRVELKVRGKPALRLKRLRYHIKSKSKYFAL